MFTRRYNDIWDTWLVIYPVWSDHPMQILSDFFFLADSPMCLFFGRILLEPNSLGAILSAWGSQAGVLSGTLRMRLRGMVKIIG